MLVQKYFDNGFRAMNQRNMDSAIWNYNQALAITPELDDIYIQLHTIYTSQANHSACKANLQAYIENYPYDYYPHYMAGNYYAGLYDYNTAIESYKKSVELASGDYYSLSNIGICLEQLRKPTEAIPYFRRAIEIKPEYVKPYERLLAIYDKQNEIKGFVEMYDRLLVINPSAVSGWEMTKMYKLRKPIADNPTGKGYLELGEYYYRNDDYTTSYSLFQKALTLNPQLGKAYFYLGAMDIFNEAYDKALLNTKKAVPYLNTDMELSNCYENIGYCYEMKKDFSNAISYYKKAELSFGSKSLYYKMSRVYEQMGQYDKARYYKYKYDIVQTVIIKAP